MFYFSEDSTLSLFKVVYRDKAQWVRCLPQKHEDWNSDPKYPHKKVSLALHWSLSTGARGGEGQSQAYLRDVTAGITKMSRSRFRERACPKTQVAIAQK